MTKRLLQPALPDCLQVIGTRDVGTGGVETGGVKTGGVETGPLVRRR